MYGKYDRFELYDSFTPSSAEFVGAGVVSGAQKKGTTIELLIEEEVFESIVSSLDVLLLFESNVDIRFVESIGTLKQSSTWEHTVFHRPS